VREFLEIIDEETDAVSRLVNQVVELARLEGGTLRLDAGPVDLARLVREQVSRARRPALPPVRLDLARGLPAAWGDRARIEQALAELLDNAARHSPPGAGIAVAARAVGDGAAVQITVQDSGPGIPATALPRLFEPFFRVEPGDSRQGGGVGLGLYLARGWIAAHGGRLWAENTPGGGATFHFTVPTVAAARTTSAARR
jgi:two-component system sensor histidine kinase KdpD